MTESKLISVIVPIYNVEKYLDRCIESVVRQKYRNLEIILVDDGSIDSSAQIADAWEKKDSRIKVIHKVNGGLSSARNVGIEVSSGEYLAFVDSDDWIHPDMIKVLAKKACNADIVCCGMIHASDTNEVPTKWFKKEHLFSSKEALDYLVDNTLLTSHIPRSLYCKKLFDEIRFPEGKIFEDLRTSHKLFIKAKKICVIPDYYYYYYIRSDSITNVVRLKNRIEWFKALEDREQDLKKIDSLYTNKITTQKAIAISLAIVQNDFSEQEKKNNIQELKRIKEFLKKKETKKSVKMYATKPQYLYYRAACLLGFKAHKGYFLLKGIVCLKKRMENRIKYQ